MSSCPSICSQLGGCSLNNSHSKAFLSHVKHPFTKVCTECLECARHCARPGYPVQTYNWQAATLCVSVDVALEIKKLLRNMINQTRAAKLLFPPKSKA